MKTLIACLCFATSLLTACAGSPQQSKAPDLTGDWVFEVRTGQNVARGAMTLVADGSSYKGTLTTDQGNNVLQVRSLTLNGADMQLLVESPNGNVTFAGTLAADARAFDGKVTYHNGQVFPMSGHRR
jgi:hypothetical protein